MLFIILTIVVLAAAALYLYSISPRRSRLREMRAFMKTKFAHRGYHCASRKIPENSLAAFKAALDCHYGIELDVHLTKDGQVAVFHDDTLERICGVPGSVESHTYPELHRLFLQRTSEKIPLLADVLSYVNGRVPLLIELKLPGRSLKLCEKTYELLRNYKGPCLIQSFNTLGLRWFRIHAPHILRGQLSANLTEDDDSVPYILRFFVKHMLSNFIGRPDFISYKLKDLPEPGVWLCRVLFKTPVAVWTLNSDKAMRKGISRYDMQIFEKEAEFY